MTDPKAGIANIKRKVVVSTCKTENDKTEMPAVFQRTMPVNVEVAEYNSKAGSLEL